MTAILNNFIHLSINEELFKYLIKLISSIFIINSIIKEMSKLEKK